MTASRALRVGLVGYGLGGSTFHAPLISATPGLELAAIATSEAGRVQAAAARYPKARIVPDADHLFKMAPTLDLVVVSTPHHTHAPLATAALAAGCHVVVDKPFAVSADEARELAALAARYGRLAIPFQNRRWDADILTLQRLLREGALGTVHRFESRYERWRPTPKPRWTVDGAGARGEGLLLDLMVHLVDQALLLFGPARDVYAEFDRRHPQVHVVDDVFIALTHANGVRSHLFTSATVGIGGPRLNVLGSAGAFVKYGMDPQEDALLAGTAPGGAGWGREAGTNWGRLGAGDAIRIVESEPGDYPRFYAGVAHALATGAPPPVTAAEAVAMMDVLEAARVSAREHRVVALPATASQHAASPRGVQ
ncbi:MAG: Gfo/Idh/MocA family oxidoreductase [Vicinamibacteria bacterium]